jgi:hypothetical protein
MLAGAWWLVLASARAARTAPQQNDGTLRTRSALTISYTIHHPLRRQLFAEGKQSLSSAHYFPYPQLNSYHAETLLETCIPVRPASASGVNTQRARIQQHIWAPATMAVSGARIPAVQIMSRDTAIAVYDSPYTPRRSS